MTRLSTRAGSPGHGGTLLAACGLAAFVALALSPPPAWGAISSAPDRTYVTNGTVWAIARSADRIYLGGSFDQVGPRTGPAGAVSAASGTADLALPQVSGGAGTVWAIAPDGSGGFYIGGDFTHVGGVARNNAAHVRADKTLDPTWNPNLNAAVVALAVSGPTVYLGGVFTSVNGTTTRNHAAAVNATSGIATAWNPNANSTVFTLAVSGSTVYLGGAFNGPTAINGQFSRNYAAAVDATSGVATAWDPEPSLYVQALAVSGSTVYLGGYFTLVQGSTRNHAGAVDATTGALKGWNPDVKDVVRALAVSGSTVYLGGSFHGAASVNTGYGTPVTRNYAAAVDATGGTASVWNPNANGVVRALAVSGSTVYLGGDFTSVNGSNMRNYAAAVNTAGTVTAWNPAANGVVDALAVSGSTVYLGGVFSSLNTQTRRNAAALSAADGTLTPWNPVVDGTVYAIALSGTTVYLGGYFDWVNSNLAPRAGLASVDATSGVATIWNPQADNVVRVLVVSGSTVYAGGDFLGVGPGVGVSRAHAAQFQASSTGAVTGWDPNLNGSVYDLVVSGSSVYLGGDFTSVNGSVTRNYAAAVDATTATATPWNPNAGNLVRALAVSGSTVYLGGYFTSVNGGTTRNHAAAVDTAGTATAWNPNANDVVRALAVSGSTAYLGGDFTSVNGSLTRNGLASVSATTGTATGWDPEAQFPSVQTLTLDAGGGILAGGVFTTLALGAQQGIATFSEPPANTALPGIGGTAAVKHTVSCSPGTWSGTKPQSYAYQWLRGSASIPAATGATYAVQLADAGNTLGCRVTATNLGGSTQALSASVAIPGAPVVSGLTLKPARFRAAKSGGPASPHGRSRVSFRLSVAAKTTFTVQRALPGKRKGSSCVKPAKRLRHARKCTRFVRVKGSFSLSTGAGKNSFRFTARLRGHALRAGMYRLSATAVDANGLRSKKPATHRFRIVG